MNFAWWLCSRQGSQRTVLPRKMRAVVELSEVSRLRAPKSFEGELAVYFNARYGSEME